MQSCISDRKLLQSNRKLLQDLVKRRFVYFQGSQIYGGCAGLYQFGPVGCAIKNNIENLWRQHFILEEDMLQLNTTCLTPAIVLQNSGHVAKFQDMIVRDVKTAQGFRADKLLEEWIQNKINKGKIKEQQLQQYKQILNQIETYKEPQLNQLFKKFAIKSPDTGNELSEVQPFNLMFKTNLGHSAKTTAYLRPETAQGMFVNFAKLLEFNGGKLPFAAAQIGLGFRNQIAPRNGLLRVKQFLMAQIQHFVDPLDKNHSKFKYIADIKLPLLSAKAQIEEFKMQWVVIGEAIKNKIVGNETMGYFLVRIYLFLKEVGINVEDHLRFRQHKKKQMAHYAQDCWDAEIQTSHGWVECVGCADRAAYDLCHHTQGSGVKLVAARKFKQARQEKQITINIARKKVGEQFKKNSQPITKVIENLEENVKQEWKIKFEKEGKINLTIKEGQFTLNQTHIKFEENIVNINQEKYTPNVIEPSFGLGRIFSAILEHSFQKRDEKRTYLCLKPRIAPVKVSILPLQNDIRFDKVIDDLKKKLKKCLISCKVDDSGQSIGKRYSRTDEIGIPFGITVDYQTLEEQSVTLRQLHTMVQLRIPVEHLQKIMSQLSNGILLWQDLCKQYPRYESDKKDE